MLSIIIFSPYVLSALYASYKLLSIPYNFIKFVLTQKSPLLTFVIAKYPSVPQNGYNQQYKRPRERP